MLFFSGFMVLRGDYLMENKKKSHSFNNRVRDARNYAGLSQEALASKAEERGIKKLSASYIQKIEQGRPLGENARAAAAKSIADLCGVRAEWLLNPLDDCMTIEEYEQLQEKKKIERWLSEQGKKASSALEDGYYYFIWIVLQHFKKDYEIKMKAGNKFEISDLGRSITISGTEIREDLYDYAEFKLKKLIEHRFFELAESEMQEAGLNVIDISEEV